jgi:hypothetical protein
MIVLDTNRIAGVPHLEHVNTEEIISFFVEVLFFLMKYQHNHLTSFQVTKTYPSFEQVANIFPLWAKLT